VGSGVTEPLVSVVITAYQSARWLPDTLESVMTQTYTNWEVILVDDGSTDDTVERIEPFRSRIRYFHQPNGGLASARNAGLAQARGDYIALLDADDLFEPEKLATQVRIAQAHPTSGLIVCDGVRFDDKTGEVTSYHLLSKRVVDAMHDADGTYTARVHRLVIERNPTRCPAVTLIPRAVWEKIGPFNDYLSQDYDYWLRISREFPITFHPDSLVRFRRHDTSMGGPNKLRRYVHAANRVAIWRAHSEQCAPSERRLIAKQLRRHTAGVSWRLLQYGVQSDRQAARHWLRELADAGPRSPYPRGALALLRVIPGRRATASSAADRG